MGLKSDDSSEEVRRDFFNAVMSSKVFDRMKSNGDILFGKGYYDASEVSVR